MRATRLLLAATCLAMLPASAGAQARDPLAEAFHDPPAEARPRVWWHWMNGNVTEEGIARDLAWMKRIGIAGLQNFDANLKTPQVVDKRLAYMTPEWKRAFRFAAGEADRLGLELAIAASPGWSETGGPWVTPEDAMKKLVWSETFVRAGRRTAIRLADPARVAGPFGNLAIHDQFGLAEPVAVDRPAFYRDVAVLAWPVAAPTALPAPRMTAGDGKPLDVAALGDGDLTTGVTIARGSRNDPATITIEYPAPQTVRSLVLHVPGSGPTPVSPGLRPRLEASDDGHDWRPVTELAMTDVPSTVSFDPVTASRFRIVFASARQQAAATAFMPPPGLDLSALAGLMPRGAPGLEVEELRLGAEARVNQFETKAGFATAPDYYDLDAHAGADVAGPPPRQVIDLTARLKADGTLDWTPPKGDWRIVRLGWSLTGKTNHPATAEATGLEVDKMDAGAARRYLDRYLAMYRDAAGDDLVGARGVRALLTDSTEVGAFNWTPDMVAQFRRLRGYDPTPWLPSLTGAVIGSRRESDAFLYDFRRTIADLHASAHYATVAAFAHENGLKLYGEALENGRPSLGDDMTLRSHADFPMAAMWYIPRQLKPMGSFLADMKGASSVAHLYGQNIAAAESMTSALTPWGNAPANLKPTIDLEFAFGINRPVIHTSVHQPVEDKLPGLSLGIFGQYFNRHETWAEMAKPWIDYIARNSLMLQQGRNVADVAYFFGEESPLTVLYANGPAADAPRASAYDFVNFDGLTRLLSNDGADLVAPSGARYRLLYLGGSTRRMTLAALRRIAALAEGGATIVGAAPESSPSLADDPAEFAALVRRLWTSGAETQVGKGRVLATRDVEAALRRVGVGPDFRFTGGQPDSDIPFVHRKLADGDSYFLVNRKDRPETIEARFRVTGKAPELWHVDTGRAEPVSYRIENGETLVPLALAADESVHVVFRKPAQAASADVPRPVPVSLGTIEGPWQVAFQPGRGAPASTELAALAALNENPDPGIRYFSGVASYMRDIAAPRGWKRGRPLWLDLGKVHEVAEVRLNDTLVGTAWHAPYRIDIGPAMRGGRNRLEIRVANLWVNRLIGDAQPGATKIGFTSSLTYLPNAPLKPSGLIGPVELLAVDGE